MSGAIQLAAKAVAHSDIAAKQNITGTIMITVGQTVTSPGGRPKTSAGAMSALRRDHNAASRKNPYAAYAIGRNFGGAPAATKPSPTPRDPTSGHIHRRATRTRANFSLSGNGTREGRRLVQRFSGSGQF